MEREFLSVKLSAHSMLLKNLCGWCLCGFLVLGLPFLCLAQELEPPAMEPPSDRSELCRRRLCLHRGGHILRSCSPCSRMLKWSCTLGRLSISAPLSCFKNPHESVFTQGYQRGQLDRIGRWRSHDRQTKWFGRLDPAIRNKSVWSAAPRG